MVENPQNIIPIGNPLDANDLLFYLVCLWLSLADVYTSFMLTDS